ncbi:hypothetical protein [Streptomyces sp. NPDC015131]|uniref:hypothetical protein n=1 Tax=Streptomyces sp. NPDC015131 TaxID=3364941 RepID=UPI0036FA5D05
MIQLIQVRFLDTERLYTYFWTFYPDDGGTPLKIGDRVEVPPNWFNPEGSSGTVAALGSDYDGPNLQQIVRVIHP